MRETDVGMYRHYLDPTEPFVNAVIKPAHGAVITSATLRDSLGLSTPANDENHRALADWTSAEARTGTSHILAPALHAAMASPFDYAGATKVLIVRDIKRDDADQVASAYRELFQIIKTGLAAAATLLVCTLFAQDPRGTVSGRVRRASKRTRRNFPSCA